MNVVETLDTYVCSFFMRPWDAGVSSTTPNAATGGSATRRSQMLLADGTVIGSITNTFEEEADGFTAQLSVTLPATRAPSAVEQHLEHFAVEQHLEHFAVEQHLEHFAVEFRTWILRAAAEGAR